MMSMEKRMQMVHLWFCFIFPAAGKLMVIYITREIRCAQNRTKRTDSTWKRFRFDLAGISPTVGISGNDHYRECIVARRLSTAVRLGARDFPILSDVDGDAGSPSTEAAGGNAPSSHAQTHPTRRGKKRGRDFAKAKLAQAKDSAAL